MSYKESIYESKWWTQGDLPDAGGPWLFIKAVTATPASVMPVDTSSTNFIIWEDGASQVANGDIVTNIGKCFIAKNAPGVWDTPTVSNNLWDEISCQ